MGLCGQVGSLQAFMHRRAFQECKAGSEGTVWALGQSVCQEGWGHRGGENNTSHIKKGTRPEAETPDGDEKTGRAPFQ